MDLVDSANESSDDSDFCPEKHKDSNSEISDPEEDDQIISDEENVARKSIKNKKFSKRRKSKNEKVAEENEIEKEVDPEEEKRKADAIWAEFLGEKETHSEPRESATSSRATSTSSMSSLSKTSTKTEATKPNIPTMAPTATEIFEFAGETVKIPLKTVEADKPSTAAQKSGTPGIKRPSGGLSSVLNQLTKKNKLSVLEKTKLDWDGFKSEEGINEELQTHNRGREG